MRQLSGRHKRKEETEMREHAFNIAHMQRRMVEAYSVCRSASRSQIVVSDSHHCLAQVTERRKNVFDPSMYPALLLRRPTEVFDLATAAASPHESFASAPRPMRHDALCCYFVWFALVVRSHHSSAGMRRPSSVERMPYAASASARAASAARTESPAYSESMRPFAVRQTFRACDIVHPISIGCC
jgi:hypothetical protein